MRPVKQKNTNVNKTNLLIYHYHILSKFAIMSSPSNVISKLNQRKEQVEFLSNNLIRFKKINYVALA